MEQSENIMRMYDTPLVTSFLQISMLPDGNESISDISVKGIQTTEAFLKITSLYQMVWHEWATFGTIYMTEFLLDEITFDELYEAIKDAAKTFLKSKG